MMTIFASASLLLSAAAVAVQPACQLEREASPFRYGRLDAICSVGMSLSDGLMLKNARPYFWLGQGDGPGASQAGPFGLWLAWLQHNDAVTLNGGMRFNIREDAAGCPVLSVRTDAGIQSWRREAVRMGLLTDFFYGAGFQPNSPYGKVVARHPDLAEVMCNYGHYLKVDPGYPLGVDINVTLRKALTDCLMDEPDTAYVELCREPGPDPQNRRAMEVFRSFARTKYGSIERADRVWRTSHSGWDDVLPPHLDDRLLHVSGVGAVGRRRQLARTRYAEFYRDWIAAIQQDVSRWVKAEIDALHAASPRIAFTIDVRGHTDRWRDGYSMLVPEDVDSSEDLFSIHQGTHSFVFGGRPYDADSVVHSASFPLFNMNYFRVNTRGAIMNAEDIIHFAMVSVANTERMKENCLGKLTDTDWEFRKDESDAGLKDGWFSSRADASRWGRVHVPGAWDGQQENRGYGGVAWYRKTFAVPARYRVDHEDGSRVFRLRGKGVAQAGTAWLNGVKLGDVKGWDSEYSFDVGGLLRYGGDNTLVWRIDGMGKAENGLRFDTYLLPDDMMSEREPFNERQFRKMAFNQLFAGLSGMMVWHWHDDALRAYQPLLHAQLQTVAEIALPQLRHRRGRVAYLYSYRCQPGLPSQSEGTYRGYGDFQCALDFLGHKPDIFGERVFREEVTAERYPLLVVPHVDTVEDATFDHFKKYVQGGGVAVLTEDSLLRTYAKHASTDVATFDRGRGRVIVLPGRPGMNDLFGILEPLLPKPEIGVRAVHATAERPLVERLLAGPDGRKVLYLCNWGGIDQSLAVTLPEAFRSWRIVNVVGDFARGEDGALAVMVPSQDVAVAVLESPDVPETVPVRPAPLRMAKMSDLQKLIAAAKPASECDVLFMRSSGRYGFRMGPELMPEYLRAVAGFGMTYGWSDPTAWDAETFKGRKLVVVTESNSNAFFKYHMKTELRDAMVEYVRNGGALMIVSALSGTVNIDGLAITKRNGLASAFGIGKDGVAGRACDAANCAFGDPCQIVTHALPPSPLADGVKSVLLHTTGVLSLSKSGKTGSGAPFPVVCVPETASSCAGKPVMAACRFGKGRVFVCGDAMAFQPLRIEHGDNAALLVNVVGWLLGCPADAAKRAVFSRSLFLTEADVSRISESEVKR